MRTTRFVFGLLAALLAPSLLHAATLSATLTATLSRDLDLSGGITCGDYLRYSLAVTPDATPPQGVVFDIAVDTNILWDPSTVTTTAPGATITPDPLAIHIAYGTLSAPFSASWEGQIRTLNTGSAVSVQGTFSGTNLANTFTDGNPGLTGAQPTVTAYPPCPPAPNVRATKTWSLATDADGDGLVDPGDTVAYTVLINNSANPGLVANNVVFASGVDAASNLVVGSATTSRGTVLVGNNPGDTTVRVNLTTLAPNTTATITFRARVSPTTAVSSIACQGTVTGSNFSQTLTDDPSTPALLDPTRTPIDHDPDLALAKSDGGVSVGPGQIVAYALGVSNLTAVPATGVVLRETVPTGSTFDASSSSAGWTCNLNQCTLSIGSLGGNAATSRTFAVRAASSLPAGSTELLNTASVSSADPDPSPANNVASDTTPLSGFAPDLSITKSDGGASAVPGELVLYTITLRNLGSIGASGVRIDEAVPNLSSYAPAAAPGWTCSGSSCSFAAGTLPAGETFSVLFAVRIDASLPVGSTSVTNIAKVTDDGRNGVDADPSNNSVTLVTPVSGASPNLNVDKTLDPASNPVPGGVLLFELAYTNSGNIGAPLRVAETVPANTTFLPASSTAGWQCSGTSAGSTCSYDAGIVPAGGGGVARFAVQVDASLPPGSALLLNCAQVTTADVAAAHRAAQSCLTVPLATRLDLALRKSDGGISAAIGDTVVYTLTATNLGNIGASAVTLTEVVPQNSTFDAAASAPAWSCASPAAGSTCTYPLGSLAAGQEQAIPFAIHTQDSPTEDFTAWINSATIGDDGLSGPDADPTNNVATDSTPVSTQPVADATLLVEQTDELVEDHGVLGAADAHDVIRYTVTIRNTSPDTANLVTYAILSADPYTVLRTGTVTTDMGVVTSGNARSDTTVAVSLGSLPGGAVATLTYDVVVLAPLPASVLAIAYQGIASGSNAPAVPSDDPDTPEAQDPTRTPVARDVHDIPTLNALGLVALALAVGALAARRLRLQPAAATVSSRSVPHV